MNTKEITYFRTQVYVTCDEKCNKAWGINSRPKVQVDPLDEDDYYWFPDSELGEAPSDPGTYEGGHSKPTNPAFFPNKWCVRECERCVMTDLGEDILLKDFSKKIYNISQH